MDELLVGFIKESLFPQSLVWYLGFGATIAYCSLFNILAIIFRQEKYNIMKAIFVGDAGKLLNKTQEDITNAKQKYVAKKQVLGIIPLDIAE